MRAPTGFIADRGRRADRSPFRLAALGTAGRASTIAADGHGS
jgi:hypothetical protein